ncbi:MAG: hypothetical protein HGA27_06615 [Peptococcaceae bacterium]|nr:hypothetical protein [Peptococcaceae bacterium]
MAIEKNPLNEAEKALVPKNDYNQESIDYKAIKDREKNMPYAGLKGDDYVRIISLAELADRTAAAYNFIEDYPNSPNIKEITQWKNEYLHDYLFGNFKYSSSFQWMDGSNMFLQEYINSYEDSKAKYKGTTFASVLDEYTNLIKIEGNNMTDKVRAFVDKNAEYSELIIFKLPK